jgi:hypothetical protein
VSADIKSQEKLKKSLNDIKGVYQFVSSNKFDSHFNEFLIVILLTNKFIELKKLPLKL